MHVIANDGNTQPPRFRAGMFNSAVIVQQYPFNDERTVEVTPVPNPTIQLDPRFFR